ncbi:MAG: LacI family DNA-binding transcriptional regulator [Firmicutes bacterium]|nr:LacI family DNA-binding transcriptional regulator [Bacillota bacterium]
MEGKKMPTIYDIARAAKVSVGTVSNVINGKPSVRPELCRRVEMAMQNLGYVPNHAARTLARGSNNSIGVLYPFDPDNHPGESYLEFISQVIICARKRGYYVTLYPNQESQSRITGIEQVVEGGQVDGFLVFEVEMIDPRIPVLKSREVPFVLVGRCANNDGLAYVDADVEQIIREAVQHLFGRGCRRIAHLGRRSSVAVDLRIYQELIKNCQQAGLDIDHSLCVWSTGKQNERRRAIRYLISRHQEFDGILISEGTTRFQFVQEALQAGINIPDEVAVIGYMGGDLDEMSQPGITAFDVQSDLIVEKAVTMLLDMCTGDSSGSQTLIPGILIPRNTTETRGNPSETKHQAGA